MTQSHVFELGTVDVNGVTLAYRAAGDPAAPPMVLLHGLGDDGRDWGGVHAAFAATYRVYALDLRGHGRSSHPGRYSFELMRDDVIGFLATVGIDRCVLIGHSMGGIVAVLLAETAPHLVTHLILADMTAPRSGGLKRPPLQPPDEPTPFDFAAVNAIRAQINDPDPAWWDDMKAISTPTLIIGGARSVIPQHLLAETAERMPDATLVTIDAGHHVHHDEPAEFIAAVDAFLAVRVVR
ncbi:alpha/beta hydrolase [Micromonospora qiuiae]|uniref:Alpha/beta hydrolase n=2 Tax=Micromonospora qiuiae TaxID=502268 RepID=A0ABQ4JGW9_9ACTN|nr:alpha/beta hydrolase [Micromonospora qiuiae]